MTSFKFSKLAQHISQRYIAKKHLGTIKTSCLLSALALASPVVMAQTTEQSIQSTEILHSFSIQSGSLASALTAFSRQSGITVSFLPATVRGLTGKALTGKYNSTNALSMLLKATDLTAIKQTNGSYIIQKLNKQGIVGTLALTTVGSGARFGDAPAEEGGFKADYQSTTSKMAMKIIDTPQAISAITRDALDARLVKTLAAAVELTPSISSNAVSPGSSGSPDMFGGYTKSSSNFAIRGQMADIRTDGFKIPAFYGDDNGMDMAAFERIEVIRGPAGFYGSGSLGGFINKVRKKPQAEFDASISLQAGSYNTYRAEGGITGAINDDETLSGRVDFAYNNAGAFTDDIESERLFVAPSIEAIISDKTRILMQLTYQKDEYDANPGIPIHIIGDRFELIEKFSSRTDLYGTSGEKSEKDSTMAAITVDHELSDRWLASLYLQSYKTSLNFVNGNFSSIYSDYVNRSSRKEKLEADNWAGELRLQGSFDAFDREHQVLFGIEANESNASRAHGGGYDYISSIADYEGEIADYPAIHAAEMPYIGVSKHNKTNHAIYGQILFSVFDNTKLLVATRYDDVKIDNKWSRVSGSSGGGSANDNAWTSRLGIIQTFNDNVNAYASYGQSFTPTSANGRNGPLEPETGEGYELGLKTEWFNNRLAVNLSAYQQELNNRAISDPNNGRDEYFLIASGIHLTKGLELEVNGSFYPGWTIGAAANLMDNEFTEEGDSYEGFSFNGSVDKQASLYSSYQIQQGKLKGLDIGATFVHMGEVNHIDRNVRPNRQVYADGYNRLDLNLSYQGLDHWDINLLVRNVTDEKYLSGVYSSRAYWGAPRSVLLQATYNFD